MNHDITPSEDWRPEEPERRLQQLAELAIQAHDNFRASMQRAVAHALEAGQALLEAKALCPDKGWTKWLKAHFRPSLNTARGYMRLATYWPELEGDPQRVVGRSYNEILRLIKGLACADGRANPARNRLAAPAAPSGGAKRRADGDPAQASGAALAAPVDGGPLGQFARLLKQAIVELRRVVEADPSESSYARHLLQPLERIHDGLSGYQWHWDDLSPGR